LTKKYGLKNYGSHLEHAAVASEPELESR